MGVIGDVSFPDGIALLIEEDSIALGKDQEHLLGGAMGHLCTVLPTRHRDRGDSECLSKYVLPKSQQCPRQPHFHREIDPLVRHYLHPPFRQNSFFFA